MMRLKILIGLFVIFSALGCSSSEKYMRDAYHEFNKFPTEENARRLILAKSDGADGYLKYALLARSMIDAPNPFLAILNDPDAKSEARVLREINRLRARSFEYYPEMEPEEFDVKFKKYYGSGE